ncbi:class I SAM-dependent methyltransferase [Candidatus Pelagibacter sp. RS39]|uniref:class I SAM-dependent methyltransferase n=1 Tax=Candidatus Pelagibacter sp. RS39 TaxID=1977864 RepID=UPI000A161EE4|nr:methyltransferase domain-containing protein [Candidatus Pelagibacter sp. RS39]ARJ47510.1 hypothetical protein B5L73_01585 [Candidatus Pelagibacter sp. RS39]
MSIKYKKYWDKFYKNFKIEKESKFAKFVYYKLRKVNKKIKKINMLDVGCGNGRDTIFFIKKGINATGLDQSNVIYSNQKIFKKNFVRKNICKKNFILKKKFDIIYARFFIHAIKYSEQKNFMKNLKFIIKKDSLLFFEFRTTKDPLMKKGKKLSENERFDSHYRRFIDVAKFRKELKEMGYKILFLKSDNNFAIFLKQRPNICRIIFKKK